MYELSGETTPWVFGQAQLPQEMEIVAEFSEFRMLARTFVALVKPSCRDSIFSLSPFSLITPKEILNRTIRNHVSNPQTDRNDQSG